MGFKGGRNRVKRGWKIPRYLKCHFLFLNIKEPLFVTIQYIPKIEFDPIDVFSPFFGSSMGNIDEVSLLCVMRLYLFLCVFIETPTGFPRPLFFLWFVSDLGMTI